ncbi:MAG: PQQ-binding-like beta-propeller repeat protein [Thermoanaerobaculia bacterium]|nr:PQQ-binding-like beta-propeller repeat protein [Thermoanaerobaculia bacterium]
MRQALRLFAALLAAATPAVADDWPQHLGPDRDGVSAEPAPTPWGENGPAVLWRRDVGQGFAAPSVGAGCVVLFHRRDDHEIVECLDPSSGDGRWSYRYPTRYRDDFGFDEGPRSAPTVAGGRVYTFGAQGVLTALDAGSGALEWQVDTHRRFGVRKGFFGAAGSPLVADGRVVLNVGAPDAGIVAFSAATGEVLWTATSHGAGYSSGVAASIGRLGASLIFFTREGLAVLDPATGELRAEMRWRARINASVNAATPLVAGSRVFLSASYGTGATLVDLADGSPDPVWAGRDSLSSHYATAVLHDGNLYGFHGRQEHGPSLRCVRLEDGAVLWSVDRFGAGTVTRVDDHLLVLREDGTLFLAPARDDRWAPLAEARILAATVRAYPAFAGGILYARNGRELVAVRLRED